MTKAHAIGFFIAFMLGIGYLVWLDAGCGPLGGVMTWHGKVCTSTL